jgi:hypothetical protein
MLNDADLAFVLGQVARTLFLAPLALAIQFLALYLFAWMFGIGRAKASDTGLRRVFDTIEGSPLSLALFLGAVVIAAAVVTSALVR